MSALRTALTRVGGLTRMVQPALHVRALTRAYGLGSHVSDNDPDTLAREKAKSLEGHTTTVMPSVPGWNEKLASDSEAVVKAERAAADGATDAAEPGRDVSADVAELQEHTVKVLREDAFLDRAIAVPPREEEDPLTRGSSPL